MTVGDNVGFGLDVRKVGLRRGRQIDEALVAGADRGVEGSEAEPVVGRTQRKVAGARAMAFRPKCLLLDEPLSNLDAKLRLEMRAEIRRIVKQTGITAIYVTHDQKEALSMADGMLVMKLGGCSGWGPGELYRGAGVEVCGGFCGSQFPGGGVVEVSRVMKIEDGGGSWWWKIQSENRNPRSRKLIAACPFRPESAPE